MKGRRTIATHIRSKSNDDAWPSGRASRRSSGDMRRTIGHARGRPARCAEMPRGDAPNSTLQKASGGGARFAPPIVMIAWPDERGMPEEGREGLRLFRESGAAAELAQARQHYHVVSWPWTHELPVRVVLADERGDAVVFECEEAGRWRMVEGWVEPHPKSPLAILREAAAFQPT